jgi:F-type H+/Na+-transporting ATPase subunit alpha
VGGSAQIKAMRKVAGTLRIDLAQYRALEAFALFASDLDKASRDQLERGARMVELLKQPNFQPVPIERQVIAIWAGSNGYLDDVQVDDVRRFEAELLEHIDANHPQIPEHIREKGDLPDDVEQQLHDAVKEFRRRFRPSEGAPPLREAEAEAMEEEEIEQEGVKRYRRPSRPRES